MVFLDERVELVLADVTALAPAVVGRVELLVAVGEVLKAVLEGVVESKELFGVIGQFAGCDVLETLRAAAFEPNAVGGNQTHLTYALPILEVAGSTELKPW